MNDRARIIKEAAELIQSGNTAQARLFLKENYPFCPREKLANAVSEMVLPTPVVKKARKEPTKKKIQRNRRQLTAKELLTIFDRDGFRCCYSGQRLILPPALVLLSIIAPKEFPRKNYPNCPLAHTHIGLWALYPSLDHVQAFSEGGDCTHENLVTTSSAVNMFKSGFSLTELGWPQPKSHPNPDGWDGLGKWFINVLETTVDLRNHQEYRAFFDEWLIALGHSKGSQN